MSTVEAVVNDAAEFAEHTKLLAGDVKDIAVDSTEHIVTIVRHNPMLAIGVGLVGLSAGLVIGYKYAEKKFVEQFETKLHEEIDAEIAAIHRIKDEKEPEVKRPSEVFRDLKVANGLTEARDLLQREGYIADAVVTETVVEHSVTLGGEPLEEFDYALELENRSPENPYIITHDEFLENDPGYTQVSITWYSGDNTLADERDEPIENLNYTIGMEHLQRFGHGSRDTNIVYVRNEKLELDFEVTRSFGKYSEEVMGFTQEERTERALQNRIKHGDV